MYRGEPEANPRAALDQICVEVKEVQKVAEITQKKLVRFTSCSYLALISYFQTYCLWILPVNLAV